MPEPASVLLQIFGQDHRVIHTSVMRGIEQCHVPLIGQSVDLGQYVRVRIKFQTIPLPEGRKTRGIMVEPFPQIRAGGDFLQP